MLRVYRNLIPGIAILTMVFAFTACSTGYTAQPKTGDSAATPPATSSIQPASGLVQSNDEAAVTIDMKWSGVQGNSLVFQVSMDTHSVDLDRYDLKKIAVLRDESGNQFQPASWDSVPGGHHRQGTLAFPVPDSLSLNKAKYIEVIIRDVAGVKERVFKWEL
ncbi:MAG: hypothetical protein HYX83_00255 [Chloroflexi bacterium]|nr:hypothetical protein [Chloroflexota bacterium]